MSVLYLNRSIRLLLFLAIASLSLLYLVASPQLQVDSSGHDEFNIISATDDPPRPPLAFRMHLRWLFGCSTTFPVMLTIFTGHQIAVTFCLKLQTMVTKRPFMSLQSISLGWFLRSLICVLFRRCTQDSMACCRPPQLHQCRAELD